MIKKLRFSDKRLLGILTTLIISIISYFTAISILSLSPHLNHLIFIFSVRIMLSFIILSDYKLSWSSATTRSYLLKTVIGLIAFGLYTPVFFMIFLHPAFIIRMLVIELVLFLLIQNTIMCLYKYLIARNNAKKLKEVVVYGAGKAGHKIMGEFEDSVYKVKYFIDDNQKLQQRSIDGINIIAKDKFFKIYNRNGKEKYDLLIIAIPSLNDRKILNMMYDELSDHFKEIKILPPIKEILRDKEFLSQLREIRVKDLLARHPKDLNENKIADFIKGKIILVTGGGGSIGSEICRQCCKYGAEQIIILDHCEFDLYNINEELNSRKIIPVLQSVTNPDDLERTFEKFRPDMVIHAAAYKHVPMVEYNIDEGIKNNVLGTKNCIDISIKYHVKKFVLISTDKAVRPTNVMGATKRICELYAQNMNHNGTEICSVRFGNVLGSSGSVIPKFKQQIEKGGPVTITHPDITRYFMLIPEACRLVLQAASIGRCGEILILDMGKPVKIIDLARNMIKLSGYPDIKIKFTGLRPGEKLFEELLINESDRKTEFDSITIAKALRYNIEKLNLQINELIKSKDKIRKLKEIVPEFQHKI